MEVPSTQRKPHCSSKEILSTILEIQPIKLLKKNSYSFCKLDKNDCNLQTCTQAWPKIEILIGSPKANLNFKFGVNLIRIPSYTDIMHKTKLNFCPAYKPSPL